MRKILPKGNKIIVLLLMMILSCFISFLHSHNVYAATSIIEINSINGYVDKDTSPTTGSVGYWTYNSGIAVDCNNRSIVADIGSSLSIAKIELRDSDTTTRMTQTDYTIYTSNDNCEYTQITDWTFTSDIVNNQLIHTFTFTGITARYIKIHTNYSDLSFSFILSNLQKDLKVFINSDDGQISTISGYLDNDTSPASGVLGTWGYTTGLAHDCQNRSVGVDLGNSRVVSKIELWDSDTSSRVGQSDYSLYYSEDNSTYTEITNWAFTSSIINNQTVHTFEFSGITARYIKIHTNFSDTNFTFILSDYQNDIKVFTSPVVTKIPTLSGCCNSDTSPTSGALYNFGVAGGAALDYQSRSVGVDMGISRSVAKIEIWDSDTSTRIKREDYSILISEDNTSYTQTNYWTFTSSVIDNRTVHTFYFTKGVLARYIKINTDLNDVDYTFVLNDIQDDIKVFLSPQVITSTLDAVPTSVTSGLLNNDTDPTSGALGTWGYTDNIAVDCLNRSVGVDLGNIRTVSSIELWDSDASNRCGQSDYTLYYSNDNSTYTQITDWTFTSSTINGRLIHTFKFTGIAARYIKIQTDFTDTDFTFVLSNPQVDIKAFLSPATTQVSAVSGFLSSDADPVSGALGTWGYSDNIAADCLNRSVGVDLGNIRSVSSIELWDSDASSRGGQSDYTLYCSNDNLFYIPIMNWTFTSSVVDNQLVHKLKFKEVKARYFKIHTDFNDTDFTFVLSNPQIDIKAFSSPVVTMLPALSGYCNNDTSPETGTLDNFGAVTGVALDYQNRSVGVDFGIPKEVSKVELWDSDTTSRISQSDYKLYYSNDNLTYAQIKIWNFNSSMVNNRLVHTFEFSGVTARYIKVLANFDDTSYTFNLSDFQNDIKAYSVTGVNPPSENKLSATIGYIDNDIVPSNGVLANWMYTGTFEFDCKLRSIGANLGSVQEFNMIRIFNNDQDTRLRKNDFSIYSSNDNITYTKVDNWDYFQDGNVITFYNFSVSARYIKVHQHFNYDKFTFTAKGGSFQAIMAVYNEPANRWTLNEGSDWQYCKSIVVNNTSADAIYDRAVYITKSSLDLSTLISQGKMNASFDDIRFANSSGKELYFYIDSEGFYVKVPYMAASSSATIYMYYGNAKAQNRLDGAGTFQVEYGTKTAVGLDGFDAPKPVKLVNGNLMRIYGYQSTDNSWDIYAQTSTNDGLTWDAAVKAAHEGSNNGPGSVLVLPNGDILLSFLNYFYSSSTEGLNPAKCRCDLYITKSTDNGATWSTPVQINTGWNYNVTYSNPTIASNGDIVLPFHYMYQNDGALRLSVMYSTDNGVTWTKSSSDIQISGSGYEIGATEAAITKLSNGDLKIYFRAQADGKYHLGESISTDNGRTWSAAADSIVYSANTHPATMKDSDNILLLWSGNNSFGGTSYMRTPLNLAYSNDDTQSWLGYRDVFGHTEFSTPNGYAWITQPDMAKASDGSLYLVYNTDKWYAMRIEDMDNWLYKSHGGYNNFESSDILSDYWWQLASTIGVSMNQKYSGTKSLRFTDSYQSSLTEGMRSFGTGIKQGLVKFKIYADNIDSGFVFSLREPYSRGLSALGTMFQFYLAPDGSLKYMNSSGEWTELPTKTDVTLKEWHDIKLTFDTATKQCEVWVDGVSKGIVGFYRDENIICYFNISSESVSGTGTDVYIDDLIIEDTSITMPSADTIGSEQAAASIPVTEVMLDKTSVSMYKGETMVLTAIIEPDNARNKAVTWSSSDAGVAAVDENGKVTGVAEGTATVTVITEDGSKTAACIVKVLAPVPTPVIEPGIIKPLVKLNDNGVAVSKVTLEDLSKAFEMLTPDGQGNTTVKLEIAEISGAKQYEQQIPLDILTNDKGNKRLEIETPKGTVVLPSNMFENSGNLNSNEISIVIGVADITVLYRNIKSKIGSRPVIELKAVIGGEVVSWRNKDAPVTVSIDYPPTKKELKELEHITVWYIDGRGKVVTVPNGRYDAAAGKVAFTVTHF
jgi:Bacterial surface proteins containing Ig-like domains